MIEQIVIIIILILGLVAIYYAYQADRQKKEQARKAWEAAMEHYKNTKASYLNSLATLKRRPNDPELKQQTLAKGRAYSALTRQYQGQNKAVTLFDEIALMNDINAACAGASVQSSQTHGENNQTVEQRLAKLSDLKEKDLITEREYETKRQKILDEI